MNFLHVTTHQYTTIEDISFYIRENVIRDGLGLTNTLNIINRNKDTTLYSILSDVVDGEIVYTIIYTQKI